MKEAIANASGRDDTSAAQRARTELEAGRPAEAIQSLQPGNDNAGNASALLAAAYFRMEDYERAAQEWEKALVVDPTDKELKRLYELARANCRTDIKRHVPEPVYHDKASLQKGPQPGEHAAVTPDGRHAHSLRERVFKVVGKWGGVKVGRALHVLTQVLGNEPAGDNTWSSWYNHKVVRATVMLAKRRERLNREQIFAAYPAKSGTGFYRSDRKAPDWTSVARTADGSYNDASEPLAGAAGTRFGFNTDPSKTPFETGVRLLTPNPRTVSRALLTRKDGFKPVPFLNMLAASWIQFMNHDWVSYGEPDNRAEPYRIPLNEDDPVRRSLHQTHMLVRPTQKDPTIKPGETTPAHINEVTSWWDGSQIYGSDEKTLKELRSGVRGKLTVDPVTGLLPVLPDGVEHTGFRRNWWIGLSLLHTVFVKEHNAICDMLAVRYPQWSDQRLFDTARLINAAVMAKIHTVEWTPSVLPNEALNTAMNSNWYGLLTNALRSKNDRRTLAEINIADPVGGGLVGNTADNHGVPYSLTREFVAVYRLHSLLPDQLHLYNIEGDDTSVKTWGLAELRQAAAHKITQTVGMPDLLYSFGRQNAGQLVLNNYPDTLQNLSIPGAGFYDLGAVDVLRDRERGVPRYNQFRRLLGLPALERFEDLTDDREALKALKSVYANIDDVDLLIGNLAETHRPKGFGFGETLFEIFILNASRRLQADRFFTDGFREDVYTVDGLEWIDQASLKRVLLRHYPELGATGLMNIENAFEPWDVGELDPARHPLRQFDKALREADEKVKQHTRQTPSA